MFYNKTNKNFKSMGVAKIGVVSCALLGNSILAGCANSEGSLMGKGDTSSYELNSTDRKEVGGETLTNLNSRSANNNPGDSEKGGSGGRYFAAGLTGLFIGSIPSYVVGPDYGKKASELNDANTNIAYLANANQELNGTVESLNATNIYQAAQISNLTDVNAGLNQNLTAATATNAQLSATLNSTLNKVNDLTQPDHFKTLDATLTLQNGTNVALNYSNFGNYYAKSNGLNLTIDQTSAIDMNSIPVVASSLNPQGSLVVNLLPTAKNICGNNIIDLSGFTRVTGITINGELYIPIIGPPSVADIDSSTAGAQSSYNLASGFFDLTNLQACAGNNSYIKSSDATSAYISDTSIPPYPIIPKIDGIYTMLLSDFQNCYSDVLNGTNFLNNGTLLSGSVYTAGQFLDLSGISSDSIIYPLSILMTNLTYIRIIDSGLTGSQIGSLLTNMNNAGDIFCAREIDLYGDATIPANVVLSCATFECSDLSNSSTCTNGGWNQNFFTGAQVNNAQVNILGSGLASTRFPLYTTPSPVALLYNSNIPGSVFTLGGTALTGAYNPAQTQWAIDNWAYVGTCYTGQN